MMMATGPRDVGHPVWPVVILSNNTRWFQGVLQVWDPKAETGNDPQFIVAEVQTE